MKRIIVELEDKDADKVFNDYSNRLVAIGKSCQGKIIESYIPITILPKEIQKIRDAIREIEKAGLTSKMIKTYICTTHKVASDKYDMVVKGLSEIINIMEKERLINKLKE